ncbi:hypothetical protein O181_043791 [Austropuccinia psidii MF-1]|uniref:Uncharacterized protein n=1 Tax=Austropuccinia psidii MF-1 TaxID=1389203 RepID=A0A9Q3DHC6_9BASI|nr:hypothetical protein [Austropuccinia psidii MF-1]
MAEVTKKKNTFHNCGSTDHYANNFPKAKKKFYAIEQVPEEESQTEDSGSESMVEYQDETQIEIQDIQLEEGMPQDTANKNLCKHTQDAQTFLVTPTKGMAYILGTSTKIVVFIDNSQHPLIIDSGAHCSIVDKYYLSNHYQNWEKQLFSTKERKFKSESGNIASIGTIIKEIIIPIGNVISESTQILLCLMMLIYKDSYCEQITRGFMALIFAIVRTDTLP